MRQKLDNARRLSTGLLLVCVAVCAPLAVAQSFNETPPEDLEGLKVTTELDTELPLDLQFVDDRGKPVRLADYFHDERPVLISLVYYRCPMLCNLVIDGMLDALSDVELAPGDDYTLLTVSIDPTEKPTLARAKKQSYLDAWGDPRGDAGWHALTGPAASSRALADAVGFEYRYLEDRNEYAHPAALFVITPEGRVSRYLHGVAHEPRTVQLALVEASQGKIGSAIDQFVLYCYQYDAEEGRYAPVAMRIMQIGGGLALVVLAIFLFGFWRLEVRQKRLA